MKEKRIIRTTANIKYDDSYNCCECNNDIKIEDIDKTNWRSKCCNSDIIIYSNIMERNIIRKMAFLVERGDYAIDYYQKDSVEVLGVTKLKNDRIMLGLKEMGGQIIPRNEIVDVLY